jgi:hypothetical protein
MLDMKQPQELIRQLREASTPRPIDPALPFELVRAKRDVERWFGPRDVEKDWWADVSSSGVVEAGLHAVVQWLRKTGAT